MRTFVIAAVLAAACAAPALAADDRAESRVTVHVARGASSEHVYGRLQRAAVRVCDSNSRVRAIQVEDRACAARALDMTVAQLNRPTLTARHQAASPATRLATGF